MTGAGCWPTWRARSRTAGGHDPARRDVHPAGCHRGARALGEDLAEANFKRFGITRCWQSAITPPSRWRGCCAAAQPDLTPPRTMSRWRTRRYDAGRRVCAAGQVAGLQAAGQGGLAVARLARGVRPERIDVAAGAEREQLDRARLVADRQHLRP